MVEQRGMMNSTLLKPCCTTVNLGGLHVDVVDEERFFTIVSLRALVLEDVNANTSGAPQKIEDVPKHLDRQRSVVRCHR